MRRPERPCLADVVRRAQGARWPRLLVAVTVSLSLLAGCAPSVMGVISPPDSRAPANPAIVAAAIGIAGRAMVGTVPLANATLVIHDPIANLPPLTPGSGDGQRLEYAGAEIRTGADGGFTLPLAMKPGQVALIYVSDGKQSVSALIGGDGTAFRNVGKAPVDAAHPLLIDMDSTSTGSVMLSSLKALGKAVLKTEAGTVADRLAVQGKAVDAMAAVAGKTAAKLLSLAGSADVAKKIAVNMLEADPRIAAAAETSAKAVDPAFTAKQTATMPIPAPAPIPSSVLASAPNPGLTLAAICAAVTQANPAAARETLQTVSSGSAALSLAVVAAFTDATGTTPSQATLQSTFKADLVVQLAEAAKATDVAATKGVTTSVPLVAVSAATPLPSPSAGLVPDIRATARTLLVTRLSDLGHPEVAVPTEAVDQLAPIIETAIKTSSGDPLTTGPVFSAVQNLALALIANIPVAKLAEVPGIAPPTFVDTPGPVLPGIGSLTPNQGRQAGTTAITITGGNFAAGATVTIGATAATGVTVVNAATITATVPAGVALGTYSVTVTNPGSLSGTKASGYTSLPAMGTLLGTYNVGTNPRRVVTANGFVWVTNQGSNNVTKLAMTDGTVIGTYPVAASPVGITVDGAGNPIVSSISNFITRLNKADGSALATFAATGSAPAVDLSGNIWLGGGTDLLKFDGVTNALLQTVTTSNPSVPIADAAGNIWLSSYTDSTVSQFTAATGAQVGTATGVGTQPNGLAVDSAGNVWTVDAGTNTVTKLDGTNGSVIGTYTVGTNPNGIAIDTLGQVWVAVTAPSNVVVLDSTTGGVITTIPTGGATEAYAVTIDANGDAWVVQYLAEKVLRLSR